MELDEKQIELVGLYLQGRLKGDERTNFLAEIDQNPLLKEELETQQAIQDGIEHRNNQELRTRFKAIAAETQKAPENSRVIPMRFVKMAASVAAVCVLCFAAYFLLNTPSDSQSLFANYYEPSELTLTRSTDLQEDLVKVKELYNTKQYDEALPLFKNIIDKDPTSSSLRLAYGNALLTCKKIDQAREQFDYIIDANDPLYSEQARWYLALLKLKEGNLKSAKNDLNILVNDKNSDFYNEAQALLGELEGLE